MDKIAAAMGLAVKDLFVDKPAAQNRPTITATYTYPNGAQKLRYSDKHFGWRQPDGKGGWIWNRKGLPRSLYVAGELSGIVAVAEGEKDADTLHRLGWNAASGEDGAGKGKWHGEYTEQLKGCHVLIFQDNDSMGKAFAQETAAALYGAAASVRVLDLSAVWPDMPEKADVSDMVQHYGEERACQLIANLIDNTNEWTETQIRDDPFLSCFKTLDQFEEEEATWLVPGWIPEGQITLAAADGGVGKTTLWCNIIASLSSGNKCVLDPPDTIRKPMTVAFLTTEDSVRKKLRKKLREAGATMSNILTPDFAADKTGLLCNLNFGSADMARFIRYYKPALCVFDPVQGFVPPDINMGSRNAMRHCMAPFITLGEEVGTTFLVVSHTNKRKGAYGRDRVADSADLWDISRSVIMAGYTEDQGIRYLSNEKNNYEQLQETVLFSIDKNGQIRKEGTTWKRDREYMQESVANVSAPKRNDCKEWILNELERCNGAMPSKTLEDRAKSAGYSFRTLRRAKDELKEAGGVKYFQTGGNKNRVWHIQKADDFIELPGDTPTPFDQLLT